MTPTATDCQPALANRARQFASIGAVDLTNLQRDMVFLSGVAYGGLGD